MCLLSSGRLTTHVLDAANGTPAADVAVRLLRIEGEARIVLATLKTNHDGRCDQPVLAGDAMTPGLYELEFDAGSYFRSVGAAIASPAFLETVPIRFGISDVNVHYHVPLLLSPYAYSTYRGS